MKKFFASLLIVAIGVGFINAQTDFFLNITNYVPYLEQYPQISQASSEFSRELSRLTSYIPSPSEIIAYIKGEELPIDPEDVATNAYISDSPMLSFYPNENISMRLSEDNLSLEIFGITKTAEKKHLVLTFDAQGETLEQINIPTKTDGTFNKSVRIPDTQSESVRALLPCRGRRCRGV